MIPLPKRWVSVFLCVTKSWVWKDAYVNDKHVEENLIELGIDHTLEMRARYF